MAAPSKIAIVTGSRAEYGLFRPILAGIRDSAHLELQLLVTGTHFDERFGATWRQIEADGFRIDRRIPLPLADDSPRATGAAMAAALDGLAGAYHDLRPDFVLLLGDRYEILSAAAAALPFNIPIGHIHGGEVTEGAIDECFRHAISKMANVHFTAAAPYAARLVRMGEMPEHVLVVGAPGLDALTERPLLDRAAVEAKLGIPLAKPCFLVTYHPLTMDTALSERGALALVAALDEFPDATVIVTGTNADPGFGRIAEIIDGFVDRHPQTARMIRNMGQHLYLSTAKLVDVVIGNSSSGIIEIPALGVPTVNIGDRQKGRLRSTSVIDCHEEQSAISGAIRKALSHPFRSLAATAENPYGMPGAGLRIVRYLEQADFRQLRRKPFYDGA